MRRFVVFVLTFAMIFLLSVGQSQSFIPFSFTQIDVPASFNAVATEALGINDSGTIVGDYIDASGFAHPIVDVGGAFTSFDVAFPGVTTCCAWARRINDLGQIVGRVRVKAVGGTSFVEHGYLLAGGIGGTFTDIFFPNKVSTRAIGINRAGQIVGRYCDANPDPPGSGRTCGGGGQHGFLLSGGVYSQIDVPGASSTRATGINDSGTIAGFFFGADSKWHGFILSGGAFSTVDFPGAAGTILTDIDKIGQVVGIYNDNSGATHGFLFTGTRFVTVDPPNSIHVEVGSKNIRNHIVGEFLDVSLTTHGFLAVPGH